MTLHVTVSVWHKGVDLVASTAYATLTHTMGYNERLLGLRRAEHAVVAIECDDAADTITRLKRLLSVQSIFYNRNKHSYLLDFLWEGGHESDGTPLDEVEAGLATQSRAHLRELSGQTDSNQSILLNVPVFRTEVLVEDLVSSTKVALAQKLESELGTSVTVSALGDCWYMAIRAETEEEATAVTDEIVVSQRRDRGLLLNPNDQGFRILSLRSIDLGHE